jgi:16S rRNA (cytosine967-C5)-methyltransferase
VATAVDLTRQAVGDRATGFVNAVLRRLAATAASVDNSPEPDTASALAAEYSHPAWLVARWMARFGLEESRALLAWNNSHPPLVVQPSGGASEQLAARFAAAGVRHFAAPFGAGLVVDATDPRRLPGFAEGAFHVQDPAQALVTRFTQFPKGGVVFDACAAPGGKTMGMRHRARWIVAADLARRRLTRVRENLQRIGATNVSLLVADALHPPLRPVDAILLDVPCLGTGTFARHPDARLRVRPEALVRLAREQAALLDAAAGGLGPGGVLCYATCSLEAEEDADQVEQFLARHAGFRRQPPVGLDLPLTPAGDLLLLPQRHGMDGAYAARLVKVNDS